MYSSEIFDSPYKVTRTSVYRPDPIDVRTSTYTTHKPGESYTSTTFYPSGGYTSYTKNYDYPRASTISTTVHRSPSSYSRYHWPVSSSNYASYGSGEYRTTTYSSPYTYKKEVEYSSPGRYSTTSTIDSPTRTSVIRTNYDDNIRTTTTTYSPLRSSYTYRTITSPRYPTYTTATFNYGRPWRYFSSPSSYYYSHLYKPSYLAKETTTTTTSYESPRYYPRTYSYYETTTTPKVVERTSTTTYRDEPTTYTTSTYVSRGGLADRVVETTYTPSRNIETRIYDPIDVASRYDSVTRSTYYY